MGSLDGEAHSETLARTLLKTKDFCCLIMNDFNLVWVSVLEYSKGLVCKCMTNIKSQVIVIKPSRLGPWVLRGWVCL